MEVAGSDIVKIFEYSLKDHWDLPALADYNGESFTYAKVADEVVRLHILFQRSGIQKGDKIALIGKNSARWSMAFVAILTYGGVVVPLLPDFPVGSIHQILNHSDAKMLFVADAIYQKMDESEMPQLATIVIMENYGLVKAEEDLNEHWQQDLLKMDKKYPVGIVKYDFSFDEVNLEDPAVISYTSGTTGVSKGVVIPHRSILGNVRFAQRNMPLHAGDTIVSFLPSAHMYGCAFEFLFPFSIGCGITLLTKTPSPAVILKAFDEIKPALILSVPLVIEKVYKKKIRPVLDKSSTKFLTSIPIVRGLIYRKIRKSVYASFGGNFTELIVGGAAFNSEAEAFFKRIKLPFTVGYGMTECGPLISYASWDSTVLGASGRAVDELEVAIDSSNPETEIGEIIMRGSHVMLGYYKNEEETAKVIDKAGWFHSGDLGTIDAKGNIHIKGRKKTMLLSAAGENIYPDEIESLLNNHWAVLESLVVMRGTRLVAIVVPDQEALRHKGMKTDELSKVFNSFLTEVNKNLPKFMQVTEIEPKLEEFEKTPKRSIKRFMYK